MGIELKTTKFSLLERIRRNAAKADRGNVYRNPPLTVPPAWVGSTAYTVSTAVTNGGYVYLCHTAGTSASSGGPTGTGTLLISDGSTLKWIYAGVCPILADDPEAPVLAAPGNYYGLIGVYPALTKGWSIPENPSGVFTVRRADARPATSNGSYQASFWTVTAGATGGLDGYNQGRSTYGWQVTFWTDAPVFAIGTNNSSSPLRIAVNDRWLSMGAWSLSGTITNPAYRVLDFTTRGGRKARKITVEGAGDAAFAGVVTATTDTVWADDTLDDVKVGVFGSSLEAGAAAFPIDPSRSWSHQLGGLMGWNVYNMGIGGTGYIATGTGAYSYIQHVTDATNRDFDIIYIGGPNNDNSYGAAAVQAACTTMLQTLRAGLPNAIIVAGGSTVREDNAVGPANLACELAVKAAVDAFGDPYVRFLPVMTDPAGGWIRGVNASIYVYDTVHPPQAGIDYYASRFNRAWRQTIIPSL